LTRTKLWRLSLAAILGFGWLFITPAYSDDPLSLAAQELDKLNASVSNLNYQDDFKTYIATAQSKYDAAVAAKTNRDNKITAYNDAVDTKTAAQNAVDAAQNAVDGQTVTVATALRNKNNAQDALDVANVNLSNTPVPSNGGQGVAFQIYPMVRSGSTAVLPSNPGLICQGAISTFYTYAGDWAICGASQNMIGIFTATLTVPNDINDVYFAAYTDDGSRIYVDGVLEASQWREQGATWSPYTRHFNTTTDKTLQLEVWWYNGGGPGVMHLGWGHSGIWSGIPSQFLSYGQGSTQAEIDAYNTAVAAQQAAQATYDDKLSIYNQEVQNLTTLQSNLTTANENLTTANQNLTIALNNKNDAINEYNQSIIDMNNAIQDAWDYYDKQKQREIQIAIAQALANQPQPTPEPSVEPTPEPTPELSPEPSVKPSPEPTPEQTKPTDPTPEPTPETTPEVTPSPNPTPEISPEPTPKPSPQQTDIVVDPTPEPTSDPVVVPDKTNNSPVDAQTANLIADLTNSSTLTKLTPEQKAAVAGALGIKPAEIAIVAEIAKSNPTIAKALQEFGDRANANLDAPMPYTLADATTEVQAEKFLADPIGALTNINLEKVLNPSEWGKDMTDDQRKKAQEVVIPVIIASNLVAAAMTRRV
jgi:outer membrane biosynthesis protein TonB